MEGRRLRNTILGLLLIAAAVFVLASIVTYNPYEGPFADFSLESSGQSGQDGGPAPVRNFCGRAGSYVSAYALAFLGWTSAATAFVVAAGR